MVGGSLFLVVVVVIVVVLVVVFVVVVAVVVVVIDDVAVVVVIVVVFAAAERTKVVILFFHRLAALNSIKSHLSLSPLLPPLIFLLLPAEYFFTSALPLVYAAILPSPLRLLSSQTSLHRAALSQIDLCIPVCESVCVFASVCDYVCVCLRVCVCVCLVHAEPS